MLCALGHAQSAGHGHPPNGAATGLARDGIKGNAHANEDARIGGNLYVARPRTHRVPHIEAKVEGNPRSSLEVANPVFGAAFDADGSTLPCIRFQEVEQLLRLRAHR